MTNKKSDLKQKRNEKIINRIIVVLVIITIVAYLISMELNTAAVGYDRWIGMPPNWK